MINKNKVDKGSTRNSNGILSVPELIHENTFTTFSFCDNPCNSKNTRTETMKDAKILSDAMPPLNPLLIFLPKNPLIRNPIKGKSGMSATNLIILFYFQFYVYEKSVGFFFRTSFLNYLRGLYQYF